MKTISELNNKWWYRLIKVAFFVAILLSICVAVSVEWDELYSYDSDYRILCNYGNKASFLAYKERQIYIPSYYNYSDSIADIPDSTKTQIRSICQITDAEIQALMNDIMNGNYDGKKLFDVIPTSIPRATHLSVTLWSVLYIVIILVISEIIHRVFYYILLGTFRPKKT